MLEEPFTLDEIKQAFWAMRLNSSPGPDGFGLAFFRAFWDTVSHDLHRLLQDFHSGTIQLECINLAYIALLPKEGVVNHGLGLGLGQLFLDRTQMFGDFSKRFS